MGLGQPLEVFQVARGGQSVEDGHAHLGVGLEQVASEMAADEVTLANFGADAVNKQAAQCSELI